MMEGPPFWRVFNSLSVTLQVSPIVSGLRPITYFTGLHKVFFGPKYLQNRIKLERLSPVHNKHMDPNPGFPQQRRPRGFAAAPSVTDASTATYSSAMGKRGREKEKERTKLRERHRRSITSRMLAGLRQHGNFSLPARADMNDVIAALARDAGWTVEADGTTYKQSHPQHQPRHQVQPGAYSRSLTETPSASKSSYGVKTVLENQTLVAMAVRSDESLSPVSLDSVVVPERDSKNGKYSGCSGISSAAMCLDTDQLIQDVNSEDGEHMSRNEGLVPVYVKFSNGFIDNYCQLINQEDVRRELSYINSLHADGVAMTCWWGIVEGWSPRKYMWSGYRDLFNIVREFKLKIQVVLAFHESGGHGTGDVFVTLPQWVLDIGKENLDIFFTDHEGRRCTECLSWGVDKERVLEGRTGVEVYFDFMRSFRTEFDDLFAEGLITAMEIGLGPSGELKYPSFHESAGWRFPGIGEFQCYDKYFQVSLEKAVELRGHSFWARAPDNAGDYNSRPHETGFFCERGDYDGYYGRFFLKWYAQYLMDHADCILSLANLIFEDINIVVKIPAVYWWYKTSSHAPELTAGYYNSANRDGYSRVFKILKKHNVTVKFTCSGLQTPNPGINEALSDPEGMIWQVLNCAWDQGLEVAGENDLSCYNRDTLARIVNIAKPRNDPDRHRFSFFVYRLASPFSETSIGFSELDFIIKSMHGGLREDMPPC